MGSLTLLKSPVNVRENRRDNQEWKIQRNWQHLGTQDTERKQTKQKHNTEN